MSCSTVSSASPRRARSERELMLIDGHRYAICDLPSEDAGMVRWVERLWAEKDMILQGFRDA